MIDLSKTTGTPFNIFPRVLDRDYSIPALDLKHTKFDPADVPPGFTLWYLHESKDTGMLSTITVPDDSEGFVSSVLIPNGILVTPDENGVLFNFEPGNIMVETSFLSLYIQTTEDPDERKEMNSRLTELMAVYERLYGDKYDCELSNDMSDAFWECTDITVSEWIGLIHFVPLRDRTHKTISGSPAILTA